ncbi:hypothetical protein D9M71_416320 [compost metagenome]
MQLVLLQAGAQQFGQAEEGALVVDHPAAVGLVGHGEFLVAEEGEMIVQQPFEEGADFRDFLGAALELRLAEPGQQVGGLFLHGGEVGHRQAHLAEHFQQRLGDGLQLADLRAAVDLQVHQRLVAHVLALAAPGQQLEQFALGVAAHADHRGLQGVDAVAAADQLHAHGIDQERLVRMQHLHRGVGGLPAVLLVVGVVDLHFRLAGVEALEHAPGRQGAADQVGQPALGQLIEGNQTEELLGELGHLWQPFLAHMLRQGRLQLLLEVGFAGRGEERHVGTPLGSSYSNSA